MADEKKENTPEKNINKMTVTELREVAREIPDITGVHGMKKDELLTIVKKDRGITDEAPAKKKAAGKKTTSGKKTHSVKELKQMISDLRSEKIAAQEAKDRKKTKIIRRRINRLKKMTRKAA